MRRELSRLIVGQIFLHACMAGMRMATPLLALKLGFSAMAVGGLLSLLRSPRSSLPCRLGATPTAWACAGR